MLDALRAVVKSVLRDDERDDSYRRVKGHVRISRWTGHGVYLGQAHFLGSVAWRPFEGGRS